MVRPAPDRDGVLLQRAKPRGRLARVEHPRGVALDLADVTPGLGGDAAQPLQEVHRGALRGQDRCDPARDLQHERLGLHGRPVPPQRLRAQTRIDAPEHGGRDVDARQDARLPAHDDRPARQPVRDQGARRHVVAREVLLQGAVDQRLDFGRDGDHGGDWLLSFGSAARRRPVGPPLRRPGRVYTTASILSRATRASSLVRSSTVIRLTSTPSASPSSTHARYAG